MGTVADMTNIAERWEVTVFGAPPVLCHSLDVALRMLDGLPQIPQTVYKPVPFTRGRLAYRKVVYRPLMTSVRLFNVELREDGHE